MSQLSTFKRQFQLVNKRMIDTTGHVLLIIIKLLGICLTVIVILEMMILVVLRESKCMWNHTLDSMKTFKTYVKRMMACYANAFPELVRAEMAVMLVRGFDFPPLGSGTEQPDTQLQTG